MKKYIVAIAFMILLSVFFAKTSFADHDPFGGAIQTKVTICHSAGGSGNYVSNTPDITGTGANPELAGHEGNIGTHTGDIIPPFHWSGGSYSGKNWTTGQATWNNNCVVPSATATSTATATVSSTPTSTATATAVPTSTPTSSPTVSPTATPTEDPCVENESCDDSTPTPTASPEPTATPNNGDVCANIEGIQTSLPDDTYHFDVTGRNCLQF